MAKVTQEYRLVRLSALFVDGQLRAIFAKIEEDMPPAPLPVESPYPKTLVGGAAEKCDLVDAWGAGAQGRGP